MTLLRAKNSTRPDQTAPVRPDWLSRDMYPFKSQFFTTPSGHKMHFIDEGKGETIVFIHGNPSWSFEFRHLIKSLSPQFRCIAVDHIGFGISDSSDDNVDYSIVAHSANFKALTDHLQLNNISLYMSDWGGPIGLDFARSYPAKMKSLIITNTWAWPVAHDPHFVMFSLMMSSYLGRYLIRRFNIFVNKVLPKATGKKAVLTPQVMAHYRNAQKTRSSRSASAALPREIIKQTKWLDSIWNDRQAFVNLPALILWGDRDIAFRQKELARWQAELINAEVHQYKECGHFLAEENPEQIAPIIAAFMKRTSSVIRP